MDNENKVEELLKPLPIPFTTQLTESNDEFRHSHGFFECFYVTEGSIYHECNGKNETLTEGDAGIICPGVYHRFKRDKSCIHRDLLISNKLMKEVCVFLDANLYSDITKKKFIRFKLQPSEILSYEKQIATFLSYYDVKLRHIHEKLLAASVLNQLLFGEKDEELPSNDFKSRCVFVINTSFARPDAMQKITNELSFNQAYLCKKFKSVFNVTLTDYINDLRIKHAAYLLQTTDYTQQKICESIGFESVSYFNKLFKRKYGITPATFKRQSNPYPITPDTQSDEL